ncbi:outer membrane protein [Methylocapsa acidiphila]|uniref:outer membrane protein n=1 Tax=Methylocapsa acidiphila TaxID=133552 RepID=UPI00040D5580|nr:outer membrane beta-barrel protein [Methylocapsa acidiphila]
MRIHAIMDKRKTAAASVTMRRRACVAVSTLAAAASLALCAAGTGHAADLPSRVSEPVFTPPPPPPAFSWTGFYAGVNVGYGIDHFAFPYIVTSGDFNATFQGRSGITASGPLGGVQVGFNYQLPFGVVLGVEVDNAWSGIRGQTTVNGVLVGGDRYGSATFGSKFLDFATARGRIGYAFDRFMVYFTGGATLGSVNTYYSAATGAPFYASGSSTSTRSGLLPHVGVVGIGGEYAVTNNITVKAEYLYDFINARNTNFSTPAGAVNFGTRTMYHIGRVGLNYKFDWLSPSATPVVAKY